MAIITEIKGSLDVAAEWARKSYEDFNLKRSLRYLRNIENRMRKNELVNFQEQK